MGGRLWRRLAERSRRHWRRDGPYGTILPGVVTFVAAQLMENENGDTSAVGWIVALALAVAVWLIARWLRNDPSAAHDGDRSA